MSEKPSGIAHHAVIHHLECISLYNCWCHHNAIVAITVQTRTVLTMSHLYSLSPSYPHTVSWLTNKVIQINWWAWGWGRAVIIRAKKVICKFFMNTIYHTLFNIFTRSDDDNDDDDDDDDDDDTVMLEISLKISIIIIIFEWPIKLIISIISYPLWMFRSLCQTCQLCFESTLG